MNRTIMAALLLCASAASWGGVASVGFDESGGSTFAPGQVFTLELEGMDFSQALDGGGIDLAFNASVLQLESVTVDEQVFDFADSDGTIDNTGGTAEDVLFNAFFDPSPSGTFDIASFQFVAENAGISDLALSVSALNPFSSGGVQLNAGAGGDFVFQSGSVSVQSQSIIPPVPEPPTVWLLVTAALIGLAVARGRGASGSR